MGGKTREQMYNSDYYKLHRDIITQRIKRKYRGNADFREKMKRVSRERYRKKVGGVTTFGELVPDVTGVVERDGVRYYSSHFAAASAGVSVQTIRRWHKKGTIPDMAQEDSGGKKRWFTSKQIRLLESFVGYIKMNEKERAKVKAYVAEHWNEEDDNAEEIITKRRW